MIDMEYFLILASVVFTIGAFGLFLTRKNMLTVLMSILLMFLAVEINFVAFAHYLDDLTGQIFALFILAVGIAEMAVGLAVITVYFRNKNTITTEDISQIKG